jgi:hypothetical protein
MATVLCVWEQGDNLGHLANLRLPVEEALRLGHRVVLVIMVIMEELLLPGFTHYHHNLTTLKSMIPTYDQ